MKKTKILSILLSILILLLISFVPSRAEPTYIDPDSEFRAVWLSPIVGDFSSYSSEASFKTEMNNIFTVMEYYKLNAMIYHVRTHNNALYKSILNPVASYWKNVNFNNFDPLEWLIEEAHKKGIEFHAWMNPYRVNSSYYGTSLPANNPASNTNNLLTYNSATILNPGLPNVRAFLIDTVMELVENYDVDAIHFDDYFYINLGANGSLSGATTILDEPDQTTFVAYSGSYNINSAYDKANWRREQINIFIQGLHNELNTYNTTNNKHVQLGIAPTGIYKNGNGVVTYDANGKPVTTGSDTGGQTHYSSYLFCDSLKWVTEEWIDYILPQSYWATNHSVASYYKVMSWWDKVVKNSNVNLYSGIGIYFADETSNTYAWKTDSTELSTQINYLNSLENVKGASFFSYKYLKNAYNGGTAFSATQLSNINTNVWFKKVVLPELKSFTPINLSYVKNFNVNANTLTWDKLDGAKAYAIYRSSSLLTYSASELINVVGTSKTLSTLTWTDNQSGTYNYGIKAISYTNTLGAPLPESIEFDIELDTGSSKGTEVSQNNGIENETTIKVAYTRHAYLSSNAPSSSRLDYNWTSSDPSVASISIYGTITALKVGTTTIKSEYKANSIYWGEIEITVYNNFTVIFKDSDGSILSSQTVNQGSTATPPSNPSKIGYTFTGWDKLYNNVTSNLIIMALYEKNIYNVVFKDSDGTILKTENVEHGANATPPIIDAPNGFIFTSWDKPFNNIENNIIINAQYKKVDYSIKLTSNLEGKLLSTIIDLQSGTHLEGEYGLEVTISAETDNFIFWVINKKIVSYSPGFSFVITANHEIKAYYSQEFKHAVAYVDSNLTLVDFILVENLANASTEKTPSNKPGYTFNGWPETLNVTKDTIIYATYTKTTEESFVNVIGGFIKGSIETTKSVSYGEVITLINNDIDFSYWLIDNQVVSYDREISLSVYDDLTIYGVVGETITPTLNVYIAKPIYNLEQNKIVFITKFSNPNNEKIVEMGIIYIYGNNEDPLNSENKKTRILRYSPLNEAAVILNYIEDKTLNVRFYLVTQNEEGYQYNYSQVKSFSIEDSSNNVNYVLNGGDFYLYQNRTQLINDLIQDIQSVKGSQYTLSWFVNHTATAYAVFAGTSADTTFFKNPTMLSKWTWLLNYLKAVRISEGLNVNQYNNLINNGYVTSDAATINVEMVAFIAAKQYSASGYGSSNHSLTSNNNGFWNYIKYIPSSTYLPEDTLPIPSKVGYTFGGWYDNPSFIGLPLTKIPSNASGTKTFYAKWI